MVKELLIDRAIRLANRDSEPLRGSTGAKNRPQPPWPQKPGSEAIIDAEPQQVGGKAVGGAGHRERSAGEIEVEPLGLSRPMRRKADFEAAAGHPAEVGFVFREIHGIDAEVAVGEAGGA